MMRQLPVLIISMLLISHAMAVVCTTADIIRGSDEIINNWEKNVAEKYSNEIISVLKHTDPKSMLRYGKSNSAKKLFIRKPHIMKEGRIEGILKWNTEDIDLLKTKIKEEHTYVTSYSDVAEFLNMDSGTLSRYKTSEKIGSMIGQIRLQIAFRAYGITPSWEYHLPEHLSLQPTLHRQSVIRTASRQSVIRFSPYNQAALPHPNPDSPGPSWRQ